MPALCEPKSELVPQGRDKLGQTSALYQYYLAERAEILRLKSIESEKIGHEVSFENALLDWIKNHRKHWRELRQADSRSR